LSVTVGETQLMPGSCLCQWSKIELKFLQNCWWFSSSRFPFNDLESPGYEVCFLYTVLVTIVVVAYASAVDGLFISFAINLRAHFQTLHWKIANEEFGLSENESHARLKSIVDYHVLLLSLSKKLRSIYTPTVFGQFVITSLQVGVIIYQLVTVCKKISYNEIP